MILGFSKSQGPCSWCEFRRCPALPAPSRHPSLSRIKGILELSSLCFSLRELQGKKNLASCIWLLAMRPRGRARSVQTQHTHHLPWNASGSQRGTTVGCFTPCPDRQGGSGSLQNVSASHSQPNKHSLCMICLFSSPWEFWSRLNEKFSKLLGSFSSWIETSRNWCSGQLISGHWSSCLQGKIRNGPGVIGRHPGSGLHR